MIVTINRFDMSDEKYKRKIEAANMLNAILDLINKNKWSDIASDDLVFDMCVACWDLGMVPTNAYTLTAPVHNNWNDYEDFKDRVDEIAKTVDNQDNYISLSKNRDILVTKGMQLDNKDREVTLLETNRTDLNQCERRKRMDKYSVDLTEKDCDRDDADRAAAVINGINSFVKKHGWEQGFRNNMSVDLCIACYILDIDPIEFFNEILYSPPHVDLSDKYDFSFRHKNIKPYLLVWKHNPFYYMVEESTWKRYERTFTEKAVLILE